MPRLGFKASPTPGLWFDIFGGYQNLKDDLYQSADRMDWWKRSKLVSLWRQTNTDNFYAGIKASYEYKDLLSYRQEEPIITGIWDSKGTDSGASSYDEASLMKPEFDVGMHAEVHPDTRTLAKRRLPIYPQSRTIQRKRLRKYDCRQQLYAGSYI